MLATGGARAVATCGGQVWQSRVWHMDDGVRCPASEKVVAVQESAPQADDQRQEEDGRFSLKPGPVLFNQTRHESLVSGQDITMAERMTKTADGAEDEYCGGARQVFFHTLPGRTNNSAGLGTKWLKFTAQVKEKRVDRKSSYTGCSTFLWPNSQYQNKGDKRGRESRRRFTYSQRTLGRGGAHGPR